MKELLEEWEWKWWIHHDSDVLELDRNILICEIFMNKRMVSKAGNLESSSPQE